MRIEAPKYPNLRISILGLGYLERRRVQFGLTVEVAQQGYTEACGRRSNLVTWSERPCRGAKGLSQAER